MAKTLKFQKPRKPRKKTRPVRNPMTNRGSEPVDPGTGLTHQQTLFVNEYLITLEPVSAYRRAGFKDKMGFSRAKGLLNKPLIQAEIKRRQREHIESLELKQEYLLRKLIQVVERGSREPECEDPKAVQNVIKSCELLGRHLGMFEKKVQVGGKITHEHEGETAKVQVNILDLGLPLEMRMQILQKLREKKEQQEPLVLPVAVKETPHEKEPPG